MDETTGELVEINAARQHLADDLAALKNRVMGEARSEVEIWKRPAFLIAAAAIGAVFLFGFITGRMTRS